MYYRRQCKFSATAVTQISASSVQQLSLKSTVSCHSNPPLAITQNVHFLLETFSLVKARHFLSFLFNIVQGFEMKTTKNEKVLPT